MPTDYDLEAAFLSSLASLAAEQMLGKRTPGTTSDLDNVKRLTILLISQGIIGNPWMVKPPKESGGRTHAVTLPISELTDSGQRLAEAYYTFRLQEVREGLERNRDALEALASLLAEKRTVNHEEIMEAVGDLLVPLDIKPFVWEDKNE